MPEFPRIIIDHQNTVHFGSTILRAEAVTATTAVKDDLNQRLSEASSPGEGIAVAGVVLTGLAIAVGIASRRKR